MSDYQESYTSMLKRIWKMQRELRELEKEIDDFFIENDPTHHPEDVAYTKRFIRKENK